MKRIIVALLLISAFALSACTNAQNSKPENAPSDSNAVSQKATADESGFDPYAVKNTYALITARYKRTLTITRPRQAITSSAISFYLRVMMKNKPIR